MKLATYNQVVYNIVLYEDFEYWNAVSIYYVY
jgi:hypothetical protein